LFYFEFSVENVISVLPKVMTIKEEVQPDNGRFKLQFAQQIHAPAFSEVATLNSIDIFPRIFISQLKAFP
jgi:hypothetical protein